MKIRQIVEAAERGRTLGGIPIKVLNVEHGATDEALKLDAPQQSWSKQDMQDYLVTAGLLLYTYLYIQSVNAGHVIKASYRLQPTIDVQRLPVLYPGSPHVSALPLQEPPQRLAEPPTAAATPSLMKPS